MIQSTVQNNHKTISSNKISPKKLGLTLSESRCEQMHLPEVINTRNFSENTNASLYSFEYLLQIIHFFFESKTWRRIWNPVKHL